jgi:hypothetical protein
MAALPPQYRQEPGHQAKWLRRTLRTAELAGLDPRQVLADAVGERDLVGARAGEEAAGAQLLRAHIRRYGTTPDRRVSKLPGAGSSRTRLQRRVGQR